MRLLSFLALALFALSLTGQAQHIIDVTDFAFVDSVSGTTETTITLGETIEFRWISGFHLVQDGTSPGGPGSASLFNFASDPANPTFLYTPTEPGVIEYLCFPHFFLNMIGTINVEPATLPGSGEDFELEVLVNNVDTRLATPGDLVSIHFESPLNTFTGAQPLLIAQFYTTGMPGPLSPLGFPYVHVNTMGGQVIFGDQPGPFGLPYTLAPGGYTFYAVVPPTLVGISTRLQALALTNLANDNIFAVSDAEDVVTF